MNVWNKVFLGIIIVTAIAVIALASVERKIRSTGQKHIETLDKKIEDADAKIAKLTSGADPAKPSVEKSLSELSIEELRGLLSERYRERGRAWFGCVVREAKEITLPPALIQVEAQIVITGPFMPSESGTETDVVFPEILRGVVYVFAESTEDKKGAFLSRFRVSSVPTQTKFSDEEGNEKNGFLVKLTTADPVSEAEIDQIFDASKSRWAIYMTPPVDRVVGMIDLLSEEAKQAFPEELLEAFRARSMPELTEEEKEGVDSAVLEMLKKYRETMDDPEAESSKDYSLALDWLYSQRSSLKRLIEEIESNIETYNAAEENAKTEKSKRENDLAREQKRVDAMKVQLEKVKTLLEQYKTEIDKMILLCEKLQELSQTYAAKIAEYQEKVVKKIEGQTENVE